MRGGVRTQRGRSTSGRGGGGMAAVGDGSGPGGGGGEGGARGAMPAVRVLRMAGRRCQLPAAAVDRALYDRGDSVRSPPPPARPPASPQRLGPYHTAPEGGAARVATIRHSHARQAPSRASLPHTTGVGATGASRPAPTATAQWQQREPWPPPTPLPLPLPLPAAPTVSASPSPHAQRQVRGGPGLPPAGKSTRRGVDSPGGQRQKEGSEVRRKRLDGRRQPSSAPPPSVPPPTLRSSSLPKPPTPHSESRG